MAPPARRQRKARDGRGHERPWVHLSGAAVTEVAEEAARLDVHAEDGGERAKAREADGPGLRAETTAAESWEQDRVDPSGRDVAGLKRKRRS